MPEDVLKDETHPTLENDEVTPFNHAALDEKVVLRNGNEGVEDVDCLPSVVDRLTNSDGSSVDDETDQLTAILGNFGKYQLIVFLLLGVVSFQNGAIALAPTWTMYTDNVRCRLPVVDTGDTRFQKRLTVNQTSRLFGSDSCHVCTQFDQGTEKCIEEDLCPNGTVFYAEPLIAHSFAVEDDMNCANAWKKRMVWTLHGIGTLISNVYCGPIGDRFGRRFMFLLAAMMSFATTFAINLAWSFETFALGILLVTSTCFAQYTPAMTVLSECTGGAARVWLIFASSFLWTGGMLWHGLVAFLTRDRHWTLALTMAPALLLMPVFWLFPESIRWLAVSGRKRQAEAQLRRAAKMNGLNINEELLKTYLDTATEQHAKHEQETVTLLSMFRHWRTAKNALFNFFCWYAVSMCYYGLSQTSTSLPSNPFLTFTLTALVELPAYVIGPSITETFGRRTALIATFGTAGISCILAGFLQNASIVIALSLIGKLAISATFMVVFVYSAELFPTVIRGSGMSYSSVFARVGSLSAPLVQILGDFGYSWMPIVVYGSAALVAASLVVFLPETKHKKLPDTIEDAVMFGVHEPSEKCLIVD